jgi:hypothetical protein
MLPFDWRAKRMTHVQQMTMVREPARDIHVCRETDVIVVGGGPAGVAAAVSSARNGADTVLVERYGHLGGLATGGLVILIMPMSDESGRIQIAGLCKEMIDRLSVTGSSVHPKDEELGSADPNVVNYWLSRGPRFFAMEGRVTLNSLFNPEYLKCILNDMVEQAGVKLFLHSWGSRCIVENGTAKGIIFESKSGRQAILAKIVIDTTGDGDVFASAGAAFDAATNQQMRSSKLALVFRVGNVDREKLKGFTEAHREKHAELMSEVTALGGFSMFLPSWREDVVWFNNFLSDLHGLNVEDLTWVEVNARKKMLITIEFFRKNVPGFESAFIMDTASQVGVRSTRRLIGQYVVTEEDLHSGRLHGDTIAVIPARQWAPSLRSSLVHIPYRSLVPVEVENLLTAGRCFSADQVANDVLAPIQVCAALGQAAGAAAALAAKSGVTPGKIDITSLQRLLSSQGVPLPGM